MLKKTQKHLFHVISKIKYDVNNHHNVMKYQTDRPKLDPENIAKPIFTSLDPIKATNKNENLKKLSLTARSISFNDAIKNMKDFEVDHHQKLLINQSKIDIVESKKKFMNHINEALVKKSFITMEKGVRRSSLFPSFSNTIASSLKRELRKDDNKCKLDNRNEINSEEPLLNNLLNSARHNASKRIFFNSDVVEAPMHKLQHNEEAKSKKNGNESIINTPRECVMVQNSLPGAEELEDENEFSKDETPYPVIDSKYSLNPKFLRKSNLNRLTFNKFGKKLPTFVTASKAKKVAWELEMNHFFELSNVQLDSKKIKTKSNEEFIKDRKFLFNSYCVFEKYCQDQVRDTKETGKIVEKGFERLSNGLELLNNDVNEFDVYLASEIKKDMQNELNSNQKVKVHIPKIRIKN